MSKKWDCDAVVIVASRSQQSAMKRLSGSSRAAPVTVGGQSYDILQFEGVGLCFCGVSSNPQPTTRIAKLAKIDKYFDYNKVILVNPNYKESQAKRARVGVKDSWYFVEDKQSFLDVFHIDYDLLDRKGKKLVDKMIPIPPAPPPAPPPSMAPLPGQIIAQDGSSMIIMRDGGFPIPNSPEANLYLQMMILGGGEAGGYYAPPVRRRPPVDQRVAQPKTKKAKAI